MNSSHYGTLNINLLTYILPQRLIRHNIEWYRHDGPLTRHDCWHQGGEHEEEHAEEETTSVVVNFARLVADSKIEQPNEQANGKM